MNYKLVLKNLGLILGIEAVLMLIPLGIALFKHQGVLMFLIPVAILTVCFFSLFFLRPESRSMFAREGFVIVSASWVLMSVVGALPFTISGYIPSFIDAIFETVSGFTTTGSTILTEIEALPSSLLFWRSFTHWIGGMGILVFAIAVLPASNERTMYVMRAEVPGPTVGKLVPKLRQTASLLYLIYCGMTILMVLFLLAGGMNLFDSLITAFGTAGTGGFSNRSASIGYYDSAYVDGVVTVFMFLFGVNFYFYFLILTKNTRQALKSEEVRWFFLIVLIAIALVTVAILPQSESLGQAVRYSSFQVVSIITTTGFGTTDFNLWPMFAKMILVLLMIIGACAGSTGGGLKVSRIIILIKRVRREMAKLIHPRMVKAIRFEGKAVESDQVHNIFAYITVYLFLILAAILLVSLDGFDFGTTVTSVFATINNVGPGLQQVGPTGNFAGFSNLSKIVLTLCMLLGRLEIYPILLCFSPSTYRKNQ